MKRVLIAVFAAAALAAPPALAQDIEIEELEDLIEQGAPEDDELEAIAPYETRLDELFGRLQAAETEDAAIFIAEEIEALWAEATSPTAELLVDRAIEALAVEENELARELADGALELAPDFADGWTQSAMIAYADGDVGRALEDVDKALQLEPRHYHAMVGLGVILERLDQPAGAFEAYSRALEIYPLFTEAAERARDIEPRARGRDL